MNIADSLQNPWVIGGGLALGVALLLSRGGSASSDGGFDFVARQTELARQQIGASTQIALGNQDVAKTSINARSREATALISSLTANNAAMSQVQARANESMFAVTNATIVSRKALAAQRISTDGSIRIATVQGQTAQVVAKEQGATARYIAKKQSQTSIWSSVIGAVTGVAKIAAEAF